MWCILADSHRYAGPGTNWEALLRTAFRRGYVTAIRREATDKERQRRHARPEVVDPRVRSDLSPAAVACWEDLRREFFLMHGLEMLSARFLDGLTYEEMATRFGQEPHWFRHHLPKAVRRMRRFNAEWVRFAEPRMSERGVPLHEIEILLRPN